MLAPVLPGVESLEDRHMLSAVIVKDIGEGTRDSAPSNLTDVNGMLFFVADDGIHGRELWRSDGTSEGTELVRDLVEGRQGSFPKELVNVGDSLFFVVGADLWKSDGTSAGTVRVISFDLDNKNQKQLTVVGDALYFVADDGIHGKELWVSDGTGAGTRIVADIRPGQADASITQLTDVEGVLYFTADNGESGEELWRSDGSAAGTQLVYDIQPGPGSSSTMKLTALQADLFFSADGLEGRELWRFDTATGKTALVKDIVSGSGGSEPDWLTEFDDSLYFVTNGGDSSALWTTDGTTAGTIIVTDRFRGRPLSHLTPFDGQLFFKIDDDRLAKLRDDNSWTYFNVGSEEELAVANGFLFVGTRWELVQSDSSKTLRVGRIRASNMTVSGDTLYFVGQDDIRFVGEDDIKGKELWKIDVPVRREVEFAQSRYFVREDVSSVTETIVLRRNQAFGQLDVNIDVLHSTTDEADLTSFTVRFPHGESELPVRVPVVADRLSESAETATLRLRVADPGWEVGDQSEAELTITNDDDVSLLLDGLPLGNQVAAGTRATVSLRLSQFATEPTNSIRWRALLCG